MVVQTNNQFRFIETAPIDKERKNMGWGHEEKPEFVLQAYTDKRSLEQCKRLTDEAENLIKYLGIKKEKIILLANPPSLAASRQNYKKEKQKLKIVFSQEYIRKKFALCPQN